MQTCDKCGKPFSWVTITKSLWLGYKPLKCANCRTVHNITRASRLTVTVLTVFPFVIFMLYLSPFDSTAATVTVSLLLAFAGSMISPLFVKYEKQ